MEASGLLDGDRYEQLAARARTIVADSIAFSERSPLPDPETATHGVIGLPFDPRGPR